MKRSTKKSSKGAETSAAVREQAPPTNINPPINLLQTPQSVTAVKTRAKKVPKKPSKAMRSALFRAGAALIASILILAISKFSFLDLIKGPTESDSIQKEQAGAFVKRDIMAILGCYADSSAGISGKYALVPMGNQFVSVHFTGRYLNSASTIETDTIKYISGNIGSLDKYVKVQGTVGKLSDDLSGKMYDWITQNKDWLVKDGIVPNVDDYSKYVSDAVLEVDTVNSMNQNLVFVLTGLAALCLVYMLVELILMVLGFYRGKIAPATELRSAAVETAADAVSTAEKSVGETDKCIKAGKSEENGNASEDQP